MEKYKNKLKNKVLPLKLAQELDLDIESEFGYVIKNKKGLSVKLLMYKNHYPKDESFEIYPAPLPCELLEILPAKTKVEKFKDADSTNGREFLYYAEYKDVMDKTHSNYKETPAEALGKLIKKLQEEELL